MFLVRKSENINKSLYTLSVCDGTKIIKHYRIKCLKDKKYYIVKQECFDSLAELVAFYMNNKNNVLCCKLNACPSKLTPSTYKLGFNTWEEPKKHFKIISLIATGNYGQVWKALYKNKTIVAIKTIKNNKIDSLNFNQEVNIMKMIHHPNLVQVYIILKYILYSY